MRTRESHLHDASAGAGSRFTIRAECLAAFALFLSVQANAPGSGEPFLTGYILHGNPDAWHLPMPETMARVAREANAVFSVETYRKGPAGTTDWESRGKREDIERLFSLAERNGLTVYALFYYNYGNTKACQVDPERLKRVRHVLKNMVEDCGAYRSFGGIHFDTVANKHPGCAACLPKFAEFVRSEYSKTVLERYALTDASDLRPPAKVHNEKDRFLQGAWMAFTRNVNTQYVRTIVEYARSLRPEIRILAAAGDLSAPYSSSLVGLPGVLDATMVGLGANGLIENAMLCELARSSARGPVYGAYGMYYDWTFSESRRAKALAIAFAHTDGLVVGDWEHAGPQPERREEHAPYGRENYYWKNSRTTRQVFARTLGEMHRAREFLAPTESAAQVAVLFSERSLSRSRGGALSPYFCNVAGLYAALTQEHIQADVLDAECLTDAALGQYAVVLIPSATALGSGELHVLRRWIDRGGHVVALGESTMDMPEADPPSSLNAGDLFGVSVVAREEKARRITVHRSDQFPSFRPRTKTVEYRVGHLRSEPFPFQSEVTVIRPQEGTSVLGAFEDGTPAVTVRPFNEGRAIFIAPRYLGLCYEGDRYYEEYAKILLFRHFSAWPRIKQFRQGVRQLIADLVIGSLDEGEASLPFVSHECPDEVELVLRDQPEKQRRILHFTNYSDDEPLGKIVVTVRVPRGRGYHRASLVCGKGRLRVREQGDGVRITLNGLRTHAAAVIEYR